MADEAWVVFKTVQPSWGSLALGKELPELLGAPPPLEGKADPKNPQEVEDPNKRSIAFLMRGKGRLRVINVWRSAHLFASELTQGRLLGQAMPTTQYIFNLPDKVEAYLGMETELVSERRSRRTLDTVAWLMPANEYYAYHQATTDGKPYELPKEGPAHVYLTKSYFPGLFPSVRSMEGGEPEVSIPVVPPRKARKIAE